MNLLVQIKIIQNHPDEIKNALSHYFTGKGCSKDILKMYGFIRALIGMFYIGNGVNMFECC